MLGTCYHSWETKGHIPCPIPVVEELQVQILKLLLDNKDDNGVSDLRRLCGLAAWRYAVWGSDPR